MVGAAALNLVEVMTKLAEEGLDRNNGARIGGPLRVRTEWGDVGRRSVMADKNLIIGRVINVTGMIGVSAGIVLFTFAVVLLLFRRGFGFDIPNPFHWFW